jgi:cytochrome P450
MPFSRTYIVNDPSLISAIQKHWRTISFAAHAADTGCISGMSKDAVRILNQNLTTDQSFNASWPKLIMPMMAPGQDLDTLSRTSIDVLIDCVEDLKASQRQGGAAVCGLWHWTRHTMTKATTQAVWGPMDPYRDSAIVEAWRIFENEFLTLSILPVPWLLAPKLFRARETVAAALIQYIRKGWYETGPPLMLKTVEHNHDRYGLGVEDMGRAQLGLTFAVLSNSTPCALWLLYHIFSDETVLAEIRAEVEALLAHDKERIDTLSIDLAKTQTSCPLLLSTFQETMRYHTVGPGIRKVLEDVTIEGWLLKKGSILMIPSTVQHTNISAWGESATIFDHRRFVRRPEAFQDKPSFNRVAFRVFGGGHVLCPGRHFASNEILALAAMVVLQFDIVPVKDAKWPRPTCKNSPITAGFPIIDEDIEVEWRLRDPEKRWNFIFQGSEETVALGSEDMTASF